MKHQLSLKFIDKIARIGSIRGAAEELAITPSALNRRLLAMEAEIGVELFERHATGVRLNTAGEIFVQHARGQIADLERVKSQIADLSGMRRGHINVACTREVVRHFLLQRISEYRDRYPDVTFNVQLFTRGDAELSLIDITSDIALVLEPLRLAEFQAMLSVPQPIVCVMPINHPLAGKRTLRLHECAQYPLLLPQKPEGIRHVLDLAAARRKVSLKPVVESNSHDLLQLMARDSNQLAFTIPINQRPMMETEGLTSVPLDPIDVSPSHLFVGHLRGRTLPVAAARFAEEITKILGDQFG